MNASRPLARLLLLAGFAMGVVLAPDFARAYTESATTAAEMREQRLGEMKQRLQLTPEQETQIKPLLEARRAKMDEIRGKYSGDTSRRAKRSMAREARTAAEEFNKQLATILSDEQKAEWEKIREETRAKVKKEMQERKAAGKEQP